MIAYSGRKRKKNTIILQKVHNLIGLQHTEGLEIQSIRRQQLGFDAVPEAFLGQAVAGSVDVAAARQRTVPCPAQDDASVGGRFGWGDCGSCQVVGDS